MKKGYSGMLLEIVVVFSMMLLFRFIIALMFGISPTEFIQQIKSELETIWGFLSI